MDNNELTDRWNKIAQKFLVGKKIVHARYQTQEEAQDFGWWTRGLVVWFEDGSNFIVQQDDEGNGAGALNISDESVGILPVLR